MVERHSRCRRRNGRTMRSGDSDDGGEVDPESNLVSQLDGRTDQMLIVNCHEGVERHVVGWERDGRPIVRASGESREWRRRDGDIGYFACLLKALVYSPRCAVGMRRCLMGVGWVWGAASRTSSSPR